MLEITDRHTEEKMNCGLQPAIEWTFSIMAGALLDGDHSTPVQAETSAIIKSWSEAAKVALGVMRGGANRAVSLAAPP